MYPPRILVSPKSVAVAAALGAELPYGHPDTCAGVIIVEVADEDLALLTGLKPDTIRRALRELSECSLVVRHQLTGGIRRVSLDADHWLWDAIAATAGRQDAR